MPPWKPEPGWTTYRGERRLTADQISLIQQWIAAGMPEGDPAAEPAPPQFADGWQLGTPDLIVKMPAGFNVPADGPDIYRNFVIPTGLTSDKWITAIELKPAARTVVHHSLFFSDTTGGAHALDGKDGQPGFPGFGTIFTVGDPLAALNGGLGGWVPGTTPAYLPNGIAIPLPKGSDFLMQTHFHPNGVAQTEKTVVGLYFGSAPAVQMTQLQVPAFFGIRANLDIPAGVSDYKMRGSFILPADVNAVGVWAHAHYLGHEAKLTATLPSGEVRILLWIKNWEFNWQDQYLFQNLMPLPKGTRLDGELTYDNSTNNILNPHSPPQEVKWGENSTDEMGSLALNVVPQRAPDLLTLQNASIVYVLSPVPLVGTKPLFVSSGMVDGASAQPGAVTPGKIVVLYGNNLGPAKLTGATLTSDGRISTSAGGTQVLFDGVPAPILYTSAGQLATVVPYEVDGKLGTQVQVRNGNQASDPVALPVWSAQPSIFSTNLTGSGAAAVINQDGLTVNTCHSRCQGIDHLDLRHGRRPDHSRRHRRTDRQQYAAGSEAASQRADRWPAGRRAVCRSRTGRRRRTFPLSQRTHPG